MVPRIDISYKTSELEQRPCEFLQSILISGIAPKSGFDSKEMQVLGNGKMQFPGGKLKEDVFSGALSSWTTMDRFGHDIMRTFGEN